MPVFQKISSFGDELAEYLIALFRHWGPLVSGAVIGLITWGYGVKTEKAVPNSFYVWLLVSAAMVAGFLAWREEYSRKTDGPQLVARLGVASIGRWLGSLVIENSSDIDVFDVQVRKICNRSDTLQFE